MYDMATLFQRVAGWGGVAATYVGSVVAQAASSPTSTVGQIGLGVGFTGVGLTIVLILREAKPTLLPFFEVWVSNRKANLENKLALEHITRVHEESLVEVRRLRTKLDEAEAKLDETEAKALESERLVILAKARADELERRTVTVEKRTVAVDKRSRRNTKAIKEVKEVQNGSGDTLPRPPEGEVGP